MFDGLTKKAGDETSLSENLKEIVAKVIVAANIDNMPESGLRAVLTGLTEALEQWDDYEEELKLEEGEETKSQGVDEETKKIEDD